MKNIISLKKKIKNNCKKLRNYLVQILMKILIKWANRTKKYKYPIFVTPNPKTITKNKEYL